MPRGQAPGGQAPGGQPPRGQAPGGQTPGDQAGPASAGRGDIWRVYLACLLLTAADGLSSTLAPAYLQTLGFAYAEIGLLVAIYAGTSLVSRAPAGRMAESVHAGRWFGLACGVFALALGLYPLRAYLYQPGDQAFPVSGEGHYGSDRAL